MFTCCNGNSAGICLKLGLVFVYKIRKRDFFLVQEGFGQGASLVCQLEREERLAAFKQGEEDEVTVPVGEFADFRLVDPFQVPLVAFLGPSASFLNKVMASLLPPSPKRRK